MRVNRQWHPSLPAILFLLWGLLIPPFAGEIMVNADGDPARHLRHGETILASGDVIRTDLFSFTRPGAPFIGFEYGSQILFALSHRAGGLPGLIILATLFISGTIAGLASWFLRRGMDPLQVLLATLAVAILTNIHWLARPHVVSWPLTLLLLGMLEANPRPKVWTFGLLFAGWANLHGGFLYGWLLIGMYLGGHVLEAWSRGDTVRRAREYRRALELGRVLPVTVLATVLTPYGWRLPWHLVQFFRDPYLRDVTQEFLSPSFHGPDTLPFLVALLGTMALLACRPRLHWTHLAVVLGNTAMALVSQRNIVLFALTAVPLLAFDLMPWWNDTVGGRPFSRRFAQNARTGTTAPYVALTAVLLALVALNHGRVAGREILTDRFSTKLFPVEAVAKARKAGLQGRIFHEFTWGGYLLYAWPEQKVFIDGGTDFYGSGLLKTHRAILSLVPGWRDSLDTWQIDLALLRADGALANELVREPGWSAWHRDSVAVLLRRAPR